MSTFKYNYYYEKCLTVKVYREESDLGEMKEIFFFNILTTRQWFKWSVLLLTTVIVITVATMATSNKTILSVRDHCVTS